MKWIEVDRRAVAAIPKIKHHVGVAVSSPTGTSRSQLMRRTLFYQLALLGTFAGVGVADYLSLHGASAIVCAIAIGVPCATLGGWLEKRRALAGRQLLACVVAAAIILIAIFVITSQPWSFSA